MTYLQGIEIILIFLPMDEIGWELFEKIKQEENN